MAYTASLIAAIFVKKAIAEGNYLTQMKLQKMVYFANGYHLAKYGEPLVEERFQAWKFGPVIPKIYQDYKFYGSDPIFETRYSGFDNFAAANLEILSESARDAIDFTWKATKDVSAAQLSNWTHLPGSPWSQVYNESDKETVIQDELIKNYFENFLSSVN